MGDVNRQACLIGPLFDPEWNGSHLVHQVQNRMENPVAPTLFRDRLLPGVPCRTQSLPSLYQFPASYSFQRPVAKLIGQKVVSMPFKLAIVEYNKAITCEARL